MGAVFVQLGKWSGKAQCKGVAFEFVPLTETPRGLMQARQWCDVCPVQTECLMTAMRHGWQGYWGGTLTAERNKLKAPKHRAKCPVCRSVDLVTVEQSQVCIACGRSWRSGKPPVTKVQKRPTEKTDSPKTEGVIVMGDAL